MEGRLRTPSRAAAARRTLRGRTAAAADHRDRRPHRHVGAVRAARRRPRADRVRRARRRRVRRLVLCATGPGLGGTPPRPLAALMLATPARYYHPRLLALTVPHIAGGRTAREPRALAEQAATRLQRPPDPLGYAYQVYAITGWFSLPWLHRVEHPSLIVAGEEDPSVPLRNARLLAARMPDARLHVVKRGGHLFLLDEPQNAVGPIRAFLDGD